MSPLFSSGCLYVTPGIHALARRRGDIGQFLARHIRGDWGCISPEHKRANHHALRRGQPVRSEYPVTPDIRVVIITQAGATTVMRSDEDTDRRLRYRRFVS